MAFGRSGDKGVQLLAVVMGLYVMAMGYKSHDGILFGIGLVTVLYDGILYFWEPLCRCVS
jgi:hypothetical protein